MPKITKMRLNLSKLCLKYCGLFFPGHGVGSQVYSCGQTVSQLLMFSPVTPHDVVALVRQLPDKQCASEPLPTWPLKDNIMMLAPFLSFLFNWSIEHGVVPSEVNHEESRFVGLSYNEDPMIVASVVLTQCQPVTDRRTDRQAGVFTIANTAEADTCLDSLKNNQRG